MSYPEPLPVFTPVASFGIEDDCFVLQDSQGNVLEIIYFSDIGWQIEVRHDKKYSEFARQTYTGKQASLKKAQLDARESATEIIITAQTSKLIINKKTIQIVVQENENEIFRTQESPFSFHKKRVSLYEKLMSLKITDFGFRAPFAPKGTLYETHMIRFQYPRPHGVVLGLPGTPGEINRNGYRFELYNTDDYTHIPGRNLYQSWPILLHEGVQKNGWVGIFHDNPSRTHVDVGEFYEDSVTFESVTGNSRVYILTGVTLQEVSHKMIRLLGASQLPPLWAFGYQQSRWSYMSTTEARNMLGSMAKEKIPLDAIYFDIDYMDGYRLFTTNKNTFGDLGKFIQETKEKNINTVYIVDPGVKIDSSYSIYTQLQKLGTYIKEANGDPLVAKVWPGDTILPDFTDERTVEWWAQKHKEWLDTYHFDGIWNDMNEPSNFVGGNAHIAKGKTTKGLVENEYNIYGYTMAKASKKGWDSYAKGKRTLNISRSGYPGIQQHAVIWHGDNNAWWEHLKLGFQWMLTYSLFGSFYTGADLPGFTGNAPDDLAVRFFQLGSFMPLFRGHSIYFAKDNEPYVYGDHAKKIIRDVICLRYSLLREWYTGFAVAVRKQQSPYEAIFTRQGDFVPDQFVLFGTYLVAPIFERDQSKKLVYLPKGEWYMLGNTKQRFEGDQWIPIDVTLETLPVYVKAGSVIIRNTVGMTTKQTFQGEEKYEVYTDKDGNAKGQWYEDDGISTDMTDAKLFTLDFKNREVTKTLTDLQ